MKCIFLWLFIWKMRGKMLCSQYRMERFYFIKYLWFTYITEHFMAVACNNWKDYFRLTYRKTFLDGLIVIFWNVKIEVFPIIPTWHVSKCNFPTWNLNYKNSSSNLWFVVVSFNPWRNIILLLSHFVLSSE